MIGEMTLGLWICWLGMTARIEYGNPVSQPGALSSVTLQCQYRVFLKYHM
jgi:hypothetical protein